MLPLLQMSSFLGIPETVSWLFLAICLFLFDIFLGLFFNCPPFLRWSYYPLSWSQLLLGVHSFWIFILSFEKTQCFSNLCVSLVSETVHACHMTDTQQPGRHVPSLNVGVKGVAVGCMYYKSLMDIPQSILGDHYFRHYLTLNFCQKKEAEEDVSVCFWCCFMCFWWNVR